MALCRTPLNRTDPGIFLIRVGISFGSDGSVLEWTCVAQPPSVSGAGYGPLAGILDSEAS